jgi:hypothetical protein
MKFCYCTLAVGEKYQKLASVFLETLCKYTTDECVLVTDSEKKINDSDQIIQVNVGAFDGHPINLKWLPFHHALKSGYETICFIDIDSTVNETYNKQNVIDNIQDGFGCNWYLTYNKNFIPRRRGSYKLQSLVTPQDTHPIRCPVECFMTLHGDRNRSVAFINEWSRLQQQIAEQKLYSREVCHEIGLAASRTQVPVYRYKQGRATYLDNFKHYGGGAKKHMLSK